MEPIVLISIVALAIVMTIAFIVEYIWEKNYVAKHFTFEKNDVFIVKKHEISDIYDSKKFDYYIDVEVAGEKATYRCKKDIYEKLEEGMTYNLVIRRQDVIELKS